MGEHLESVTAEIIGIGLMLADAPSLSELSHGHIKSIYQQYAKIKGS
jgi:hypothetical protein